MPFKFKMEKKTSGIRLPQMEMFTEKNLIEAKLRWLRHYVGKEINKKVLPFLSSDMDPLQSDWIRSVRNALMISTGDLALRLGVTRAAIVKMEASEKAGAISLQTLRKAAEAMDCELIYAIRSKKRDSFAQMIWRPLYHESKNHYWVRSRPQKDKGQALAAVAIKNMNDAKFRRDMGWTARGTRKTWMNRRENSSPRIS